MTIASMEITTDREEGANGVNLQVAAGQDVALAVVTITLGGLELTYGQGSSKRHPTDAPDVPMGRNVAIGRALVDAGNQLLQGANMQVQRAAAITEAPHRKRLAATIARQQEDLKKLRLKVKRLKHQKGKLGAQLIEIS